MYRKRANITYTKSVVSIITSTKNKSVKNSVFNFNKTFNILVSTAINCNIINVFPLG